MLEHDLVEVDVLDVPEAHDVVDQPELLELAGAERCALHHRRYDRAVDAEHDVARFESLVDLVDRVALGYGFELEHDALERLHDARAGLEELAVQQPGVARADPRDVVGRRAAIEEPADRVERGLAPADDDVAGGRVRDLRQLAHGNALHAVGDAERRRFACRHARRHVRRVDDSAPHGHVGDVAVEQRAEAPIAEVVAHREEPDPTRREQSVAHDLVVVAADLRAAGALVEAGFAPVGLDAILPEHRRVDAVGRGRLVELHERIRVEPVTAGAMPSIDHDDIGVGVFDQAVDERDAHRPGTHDEVVGRHLAVLAHDVTLCDGARGRTRATCTRRVALMGSRRSALASGRTLWTSELISRSWTSGIIRTRSIISSPTRKLPRNSASRRCR